MERLNATTADGVRLELRRFAPAGSARAVLLCTHAMMANGRYFHRGDDDGFAGHLARMGVDVFVLDWRGHGASVPPDARTGDWTFDDYVQLDLPAAVAECCRAAGIAPVDLCYLGHSLGGLAGLAAIGTGELAPPRHLVLMATSVWLPGPTGPRYRRWAMRAYRATARLFGRAPIRALRFGSDDEPRGYVDQLTGWAASGRWTSLTGVDYLARLPSIATPVFAATGSRDRLCLPADARVLTARLPGADQLRVVPADHFTLFTDPALRPLWSELGTVITS